MLQEGDKAPAFSLDSDSGKKISLSDFKGKTLVLYFYPKDNTPGCTREAIAFSGAADAFAKAGATVVGVSKDSVASHVQVPRSARAEDPARSRTRISRSTRRSARSARR